MTRSLERGAARLVRLAAIPFALMTALAVALAYTQIENGGAQLAFVAIAYAPMVLYLWATWRIIGVLRTVAGGGAGDPALPGLLKQVGIALFAGAILTVFGVPLLTWLVSGDAWIRTFEASPVMVGVIGAALMVVAGSMQRGIDASAELRDIF